MFESVRYALKRSTAVVPPAPPLVYEPTARLVYSDLGLPELFVHAATRGGMVAKLVHVEELATEMMADLSALGIGAVAMTGSPLLRKVRLSEALADLGIATVAEVTPTASLVAGCDSAVGETGSLVFRGGVPTGWAIAAARVVVVEPKNLVPDLIDLLAKRPGETAIVSGPAAVRAFVLH